MPSTTTYGNFPGVKIETTGGSLAGVTVGREQKLVLIGYGDPASGSANVNEPTQIQSQLDADRKFGDGSRLANQMKDALSNGANISFLFGVMLDEKTVSAESFAGTTSGTLANAPIVEDLDTITVRDTTDATDSSSDDFVVEFNYESPPPAPTLDGSETDKVFINPNTGEWEADSSSDYEFDYEYGDWSTAISEAGTVIAEEETAVIATASDAESVASTLSGQVNTLREDYKLAVGLSGAEPNLTDSDGTAAYDTGTYTDAIDNDSLFLHATARKEGSVEKITGGLGGLLAGNALDDSIYRDTLNVGAVEQRLSLSDANNLRDAQVIPIRQPPTGGSVVVSGNLSTSTETDYERDYFTKRIVDQVILVARVVGQSTVGRINTPDTRASAREQIRSQLKGLAEDGLIESDGDSSFFINVFEVDANTIGIDLGVTPFGVVKRVEVSLTVSQ